MFDLNFHPRHVINDRKAQKISDGEVKAANMAIIGQLKQFGVECGLVIREDPNRNALTKPLECETACVAKLSVDDILEDKLETSRTDAKAAGRRAGVNI